MKYGPNAYIYFCMYHLREKKNPQIEILRKRNIPFSEKRCNLRKSKAVECLWAQNKVIIKKDFFLAYKHTH